MAGAVVEILYEYDGTNEATRPDGPTCGAGDWCGVTLDSSNGDAWRCTVEVGHEGPHASHGLTSTRPLIVWNG